MATVGVEGLSNSCCPVWSLERCGPSHSIDHIWAVVWSGARGNIVRTAL